MALQRITFHILADRFGGTARWYERRIHTLLERGLLKKQGRYFFGDLEAIGNSLRVDDYSGYRGAAEKVA